MGQTANVSDLSLPHSPNLRRVALLLVSELSGAFTCIFFPGARSLFTAYQT